MYHLTSRQKCSSRARQLKRTHTALVYSTWTNNSKCNDRSYTYWGIEFLISYTPYFRKGMEARHTMLRLVDRKRKWSVLRHTPQECISWCSTSSRRSARNIKKNEALQQSLKGAKDTMNRRHGIFFKQCAVEFSFLLYDVAACAGSLVHNVCCVRERTSTVTTRRHCSQSLSCSQL